MLSGRAMPAQNARLWDHTYVASSCGLRWGCFGRDRGGREVCRGPGDSAIADCLSQPNSTTGLVYGVTGVCHQAANWILGPADILVTKARGYVISVFSYGTYGKNRQHPSLSPCYGAGGSIARQPGTDRPDGTYLASRISTDRGFVGAGSASSETDAVIDVHHPARVAELRALINEAPGVAVSADTFERLIAIRGRLWEEQSQLAMLLERRVIDHEEFLMRMSEAHTAAMSVCRSVLGDDFFRVFGEAGLEPDGVIERDIFLEQHNAPDASSSPAPFGG